MNNQLSYEEFQSKYTSLRNQVYKDVPLILGMPALRLSPINTTAIQSYKTWPSSNRIPPAGGWDWGSWVGYFRSHHKKYFDVAIWNGDQLCGLALGRLSKRNVKVRLDIIEGTPNKNHPLKGQIAYIGLTAMEAFGYAVGAEESLIIDPVKGAITAYSNYGYKLRTGNKRDGQHMFKSLI